MAIKVKDIHIEYCISEHYDNKKSLMAISKEIGVSDATVKKWFKEEGLIPNNYQNALKMNENFFDVIDTEEKAYWLGFFGGDGYISKNSYNIELSLQLSDISHLNKFKEALDYQNDIKSDSYRCRLCFANKKLHSRFQDFGITPKKSLTYDPVIKEIPKNLLRHWIRGLFDADGYIKVTKPNDNLVGIELSATIEVRDLLIRLTGLPCKTYTDNRCSGIVKSLSYNKQNSIYFLKLIYNDSNIFLARKKDKFARYMRNHINE